LRKPNLHAKALPALARFVRRISMETKNDHQL
jgi:hypothetical protein